MPLVCIVLDDLFFFGPSDPPMRRNKPPSLVSLCLGVLGQYLEDIMADLADIVMEFPPDTKVP